MRNADGERSEDLRAVITDVHDLEILDGTGEIDGIVLQALGPDGEPLVVTISRRSALKKLGKAAALASLSPRVLAEATLANSAQSATPIEHLRLMYRSLVESDNLFGSAYALQGTHDHLRIADQLCGESRGEDRKGLLLLRAQFAESMAWLTQDQADHDEAWRWTDRALEWSHLAGDPFLTATVLVRKSQLAGDRGNGSIALDYANAVAELASPGSKLPAVAALCAAHGHALTGDRAASDRAFDTARNEVQSTDLDPAAGWGSWLDLAYIDAQEARSLTALGRHAESIEAFDRAITALPAGFPRDRGVHLARAAQASSLAGEVDQAAKLGTEALQIGQSMKSGRIDTELASLLRQFEPIDTESVVEFRELAHAAAVA